MSRLIDINAVIRMLNTLDRYTSTELTLCDTDKTFPKNEVFVVDDVYEGLEQLPSAEPKIIYCKDCVYANHLSWLSEGDGKGIYLLCEKSYVQVSPCSFCSRAKMRGGNSE